LKRQLSQNPGIADDHAPLERDEEIRKLMLGLQTPQTFAPEQHPELALDYLFETLCATRRVARVSNYNFVGYLIEMAILEVDNERKIENCNRHRARTEGR